MRVLKLRNGEECVKFVGDFGSAAFAIRQRWRILNLEALGRTNTDAFALVRGK